MRGGSFLKHPLPKPVETVVCPNCNGVGAHLDFDAIPCSACQTTGRVSPSKLAEMEARIALRRARTTTELAAAWTLNCEHFQGNARLKMQQIYTNCLRKLGALHG